LSKVLRFGISAAILGFVAWRTDWSDVAQRFAGLHIAWWWAAFGLLLLGLTGSARRWQIYGKELGFDRSWPQYCTYYFVGMYFNLVLPTSVGGDVLRVVYLNGHAGRKWPAFVSVLLERLNGLAVLIAFACVGLLFCPFALPWWILTGVLGSAAGALLALVALRLVQRSPRLSAVRRGQMQLVEDLLFSARLWLRTAVLSILTQAAGILVVACLALSIGLDIPFAYVCVFTPMLTLLMLLPISVGGTGVREGGMILFLAPLGIDSASALALAFLLFAVGAAVSLIGGGLYLLGAVPAARTATAGPCQ
jgi:hypothetical protein